MEEVEDASGVHRPFMEVEQHSTDEKLEQVEELPNTQQQCEAVAEMVDSHVVGISPVVADVAGVVEEEGTLATEVEMEIEEAETTEASRSGGRRKRGRQSRVQTKAPSKRKDEEDVCFICFDGGNLVLCDRRGCPKAYHLACVKRNETFFPSKGHWNCEWHICTICAKSAQFMCYTCTYSLCKVCIKEAGFICVRGNKGFCAMCLKMVMLIEKNEQASNKMDQVDFDDKNSWEYLFKDYWVALKGKLSFTLDEVTQAGNPWKAIGQKEESSDEIYDANEDKGFSSDSSAGNLEVCSSKQRNTKKQLKSSKDVDSSSAAGDSVEGTYIIPVGTEWASKELLEFVVHMKKGDRSVLSQFDVQALLLEYIKRNNLRDPRRKSQIICDSRLENLFGKSRVGHFEMLKLLEVHLLMKENSHPDNVQGGVVDTEGSQVEVDNNNNNDALTKAGKDKKRKIRTKGDEKEPQINLDDYAAIDVHNISLIYLRRNLTEELLKDAEAFHDKVVGSLVKIRISGSSQKQDMYRLVQVVGTSKVDEPYKTGKRAANIMLEILNLNKKEKISIDTISNLESSEDECKRLRQSIKCGFIKRMTVGEVQEKAMALQTVRVNDWLETEILRLSHLRDRANEKGHRKELRECVEKLQLLKTSEERSRRLQEIPEVHADPNMDPSHESDENEEPDDSRRDNCVRPRDAGFGWKGREPISPGKGGSTLNDFSWSGGRKNIVASWEQSKAVSGKGSFGRGDLHQPSTWDLSKTQVATTGSDTSQTTLISGSSSGLATESTPSPSVQSPKISDTEKTWLYQDPSGKIQGPFSMVQLHKWSTTAYFPAHLRIWRTERRDESILLTDALNGKFYEDPPRKDNSFSQSQKAIIASGNRENLRDSGWRRNKGSSWTEKTRSDGSWNPSWKDSGSFVNSNGNDEYAKNDGWASWSTGWHVQAMEAVNPKEVQGANSSRGWDSLKANSAWSGQPQVHSPHPSSRIPLQQGRDGQGGDGWSSVQNHGTWNANRSIVFQSSCGYGHEKQSVNWGSSGQSSLESGKSEQENNKSWSTPSSVEAPKFAREGWASDHGRIK